MTMRVAEIHTSDRNFFKGCRRRWNWQSPLREGLERKERITPLWFGTGWHFVMEDYHGYGLYGDPHAAWTDYVKATLEYYGENLMPQDWREGLEIGHKMIDYYFDVWLIGRDPVNTYWHEGIPQVEVQFRVTIPFTPEQLEKWGYDRVDYVGTIDRVCEDVYGNLWVGEYKSAKRIANMHFMSDPQITAYLWAAPILYGQPFAGTMYQQWRKAVPEEPRITSKGKVSTAETLQTTHRLYRQTLIKIYGEPTLAPKENVDYLNRLAQLESAENDGYVRRDWIERSEHALQVEGIKIMMETEDMLDMELPLYPNPVRECAHFCPMFDACCALDDGGDWDRILELEFMKKKDQRGRDQWRTLLKHNLQPPKPQASAPLYLHPEERLQILNRQVQLP